MSDAAERTTPVANDYNEHNRTFEIFIALIKWGTVSTVVILILMAIFLL
ncbi:MAG: aa3-type cytochrome c oxidase subunit IV [Rhizobiales bacterium]|nr:aa3-type cytochrome c oxidase subunit IV [Hyphomicrobiales bacterium]MBO6700197.1 aa3-type cytochrome c oxidase subunit IV [Hyphomicrobiales bacterium]MBO6737638.1 aa3-type cytochrome c oxidase subunit IV [Hyphomicrobiales bacterium]MBO6913305.1 aa3-type cytochrome c oxidase subunit IV [Hyphomicrobiales bacterium]MBO6956853.1 aa3-type cytochrome c oxidase subunit IV [Hyphomicrobiales bacterium]